MTAPRIHNPDALLPDWLQELKTFSHAATQKAKQNPGQTMVFNGKFWVPVEKLIVSLNKLIEISIKQNEALGGANSVFIQAPELANSHISRIFREARDSFQNGEIVTEDK